jgi:hypothetical protein
VASIHLTPKLKSSWRHDTPAKDEPQNRRLLLIASDSYTTKIPFAEQASAQSSQLAAMALAHQITNQPLLSSPPCLPRASGSNARTARQPPFLGQSCCLTLRGSARSCLVVRASSSAQAEPKSEGGEGGGEGDEPYEEYEVEILKPYGLKFTKGQDGGTYIEAIFPGSSAEQTGKFTPGDKVLATRSVFSNGHASRSTAILRHLLNHQLIKKRTSSFHVC